MWARDLKPRSWCAANHKHLSLSESEVFERTVRGKGEVTVCWLVGWRHFHDTQRWNSNCSLRKQLTLGVATADFPAKWRLRNERRKAILMTRHYPDMGSASNWSGSYTSPIWNFYTGFSDVISRTNHWWRREMSARLRVVPPFFLRDSRASETRARVKITHARKGDARRVSPFSRGVIFTRARVLLALLSLRTSGGLLVV